MLPTSIFDQITNDNKIFINRDILQSTYIPETLPHREKETTEIATILLPIFQKETPSNILIFGKPGTGKTSVTKNVGKQIKGKTQKINFIYINCQIIDTQYRVLQNIAEQIDPQNPIPYTGLPIDLVYKKTIEILEKENNNTIVILDEVDKLKNDSILLTLTRINENLKKSKLSLICISNNVKFFEFIDPRIKSSLRQEVIIFKPYDAQELEEILRQRAELAINKNVLEEGVIQLCAALAAQNDGDARRALDLLRVSVELAERSHDRIATNKHVRLAQDKIEKDRIAEVIRSLPAQERLLLHAINRIEQHNKRMERVTPLITGEIYSQYVELAKIVHYNPLTQRRVADFISELEILGIITARVISKGRHGRTKEIKLSSSIDLTNILQQDDLYTEISRYRIKNQLRLI